MEWRKSKSRSRESHRKDVNFAVLCIYLFVHACAAMAHNHYSRRLTLSHILVSCFYRKYSLFLTCVRVLTQCPPPPFSRRREQLVQTQCLCFRPPLQSNVRLPTAAQC